MKPARIIVLIIAVAAGGIAALLAGRSERPPAKVQVAPPPMQTVEVLIAREPIEMGRTLGTQNMRWQVWPADAASASFVRRSGKPNAMEEFSGALARTAFVAGEPIREDKIIKAGGSGFMAAILPSGKRAYSTEISAETGAGGFILPNDRVDVILTRRGRDAERRDGGDAHTSEIILSDIRVLAIDQAVQERDGQRVAVGRTATLELTPGQTETAALAKQLGTLSLALRSLADANNNEQPEDTRRRNRQEINMVRFGVTSTASQR